MSALDWSTPFEELEEGTRFRTRGRTITEADVVGFATLTGDLHPQHTDAEWASRGLFGERIAHGMLVVSYAVGLVPFDPERVLALRRVSDLVFKRPARIGDTIHVEGRIASLKPIDDRAGLVSLRWDIADGGGLVLCRAAIDVLWATGAPDTEDSEPSFMADAIDLPPGVIPC